MKLTINELMEKIGFTAAADIADLSFETEPTISDSLCALHFITAMPIPTNLLEQLLIGINNYFKRKTEVSFTVTTQAEFNPVIVHSYLVWVSAEVLLNPLLADALALAKVTSIRINEMAIQFKSPSDVDVFNAHRSDLLAKLAKFGFGRVALVANSTPTDADDKASELATLQMKHEAFNRLNQEKKATEHLSGTKTVNRRQEYAELGIEDLRVVGAPKVLVKGEIFYANKRSVKDNAAMYEFGLTNFKDAIVAKYYSKKGTNEELEPFLRPGQYVQVKGDYTADKYANENIIFIQSITKIESPFTIRKDDAPLKRVELNVRTKMSTMDGLVNPAELVMRALEWGHDAIGIVDQDSVQAFPEFYAACRKAKIKGLYGASLGVVSANSQAIWNPKPNQTIIDDHYLVIDIETTGLHPQVNEIIEFSGCEINNGVLGKNEQFFIKPTQPLSPTTVALTKITDEMIQNANALTERAALEKIVELFADRTIVAHNASFDVTFINEKLAKHKMDQIKNPIIDTMVFDRILNPTAKKFRLENVAVRHGVDYDVNVAHRADYDTSVLANVWINMIAAIRSNPDGNLPVTHGALFTYQAPTLLEKRRAQHVSVLALNQSGLKELFQLVSSAHTEKYFNGPKLFVADIRKHPNLLIGSGALQSPLIDRLLYGSSEQVRQEIAHYDYIEVQAVANFVHIIGDGLTEEDIKRLLKFLITEAKSQGKLVVATGDVRYIDPNHRIYHEIIINSKGLGGTFHYLYDSSRPNGPYPVQNFLTTNEMMDAFSFLGDRDLIQEIVVTNSRLIAEKISDIQVIKDKLYTPQMEDADANLRTLVYQNAHAFYGEKLPSFVSERIEKEMVPIIKHGFGVIYWLSHLLVAKSLNDGFLVGSRGSVGSSFVATMASITEVNPLPPHYVCAQCKKSELGDPTLNSGYDLPNKLCPDCGLPFRREGQNIPFETFLGFDANKTPDIDLNFSGDYQTIIHEEVRKIFGESHCFRAGTISTIADKMAFGYALAYNENKNKGFSRIFVDFLARGIVGVKRTTGQHPGGMIIIPRKYEVEDFTPINYPANETSSQWKTTHFDFNSIHDNVLKLDLLGHDDPTAIRMLEAITGVNARKDIPFTDEKIIAMFNSTAPLGITPSDIRGEPLGIMGIPEFGTRFVRQMLRTAKVTSFGDIIAVSGLSHGTDVWVGNAEPLVSKQGKKLSEIISCRDDIMTQLIAHGLPPLLSFQIMERVRKGQSLTPEQEEKLVSTHVASWYIDSLKKIKYMFPKAHATAYVMMAWRIAWFKLYHPLAYYATFFTTRADVFDIDAVVKGKIGVVQRLDELEKRRTTRNGEEKLTNREEELIPVLELVNEAYARNIKFSQIDINRSDALKWIIDEKEHRLIPPFIAVDGLGKAAADSIVAARVKKPFSSFQDFSMRTSVNKTIMEKLQKVSNLGELAPSDQLSLNLFGI